MKSPPSTTPAGRLRALRGWLPSAIAVAVLIGVWQLAAMTGAVASALHLEPYLVPSPSEIVASLWESRSLLAENGWITLQEVLLGFCCGLVAGLCFAVILHLSETLRRAFYPLLIASQAVPIPVISPILLVWLGFGIGPKLVIVALICFFPVAVNALDGLRSVDPEATKMMRTLDASRWQILRRVEAPTTLPYVFSGAKIAVAVAVIGAVFGEWAGADAGLGWLINQDIALLETARAFASVVVLSVMAISLFGLLALAERRIVTWR